jgi:hypothetical protein
MSSHLPNTPPQIAVFSVESPQAGRHWYTRLSTGPSSLISSLGCLGCHPQDYASDDDISVFNRSLPLDLVPLRSVPCAAVEALYRFTKGLLHVARVRPGHPFPMTASLLLILFLPGDPGTKATS